MGEDPRQLCKQPSRELRDDRMRARSRAVIDSNATKVSHDGASGSVRGCVDSADIRRFIEVKHGVRKRHPLPGDEHKDREDDCSD